MPRQIDQTIDRLDRCFGPAPEDWSDLPAEEPHEDDREYGDAVGVDPGSPWYPWDVTP